ncbi:hypothetical protein ACFXTI_025019 [Malus domestica]
MALASCQADFYKFSYVDHLQGRPSNYEFFENDFETFSISPVHLLYHKIGGWVSCFNEAIDPTSLLRFQFRLLGFKRLAYLRRPAKLCRKTGGCVNYFDRAVDPSSSL